MEIPGQLLTISSLSVDPFHRFPKPTVSIIEGPQGR